MAEHPDRKEKHRPLMIFMRGFRHDAAAPRNASSSLSWSVVRWIALGLTIFVAVLFVTMIQSGGDVIRVP